MLYPTFFFLFYSAVVHAGSANNGDPCDLLDNRLQAGTYQFFSDCNSVTYCAPNSTCIPKVCRKDAFPFGYPQDSPLIPPMCEQGVQFCPDEASGCQNLIAVGQPCQLNRDDSCQAPPNFAQLADTSNQGRNFNGSVCLNNVCYYANVGQGQTCVAENLPYIGYGGIGEFIDIVSRDNCQIGFYCDVPTSTCNAYKLLGDACDADKECGSMNCQTVGTCGPAANQPRHVSSWVYAVVAIAILGGMFGTLLGLYILHRRDRDREQAKRAQYWKEQKAYHQSLQQLRDSARGSMPAHHSNLSDDGSDESHAPILQNAAPRATSGLRYASSDNDDDDLMMQPQNQVVMRADGRF